LNQKENLSVYTLNVIVFIMKKIFFKNENRGHANHGWLESYHTFSFASYHDPSKIHFGALRVLNDDTVKGGMGFGKHPHENMEIVSIPLEGILEHQDSLGNKTLIKKGEVQIMSAGTGIYHSEKNHESKETVKFLQIWVFPKIKNIEPRYDQKFFERKDRLNKFQTIVSPLESEEDGVKINQDAWFSLIETDQKEIYELKKPENGIFVFLLEGKIKIDSEVLNKRDGIGIYDTKNVTFDSVEKSEILIMEIPMKF
jgi:redox-sensitive bicupin YhaK (pirin superfamily)